MKHMYNTKFLLLDRKCLMENTFKILIPKKN